MRISVPLGTSYAELRRWLEKELPAKLNTEPFTPTKNRTYKPNSKVGNTQQKGTRHIKLHYRSPSCHHLLPLHGKSSRTCKISFLLNLI